MCCDFVGYLVVNEFLVEVVDVDVFWVLFLGVVEDLVVLVLSGSCCLEVMCLLLIFIDVMEWLSQECFELCFVLLVVGFVLELVCEMIKDMVVLLVFIDFFGFFL